MTAIARRANWRIAVQPSSPMPRFAANLTWMFTEWALVDRIEAAAEAGFEAIEILAPYTEPAERLAERVRQAGVAVALINSPAGQAGERGLAALPGREADFAASLARALDYAEALAAPLVHVMAGTADPGDAAARAAYAESLALAAGRLGERGRGLTIEPLNGRDAPGYFLRDFGQAERIAGEVGAPNLRLQFDLYHRQILHGDVLTGLRAAMPIVGHVQVASVPSRNEPDGEELNHPALFAELDRLGYAGFVGCEYRPRAGTLAGLGWLAPYLAGC